MCTALSAWIYPYALAQQEPRDVSTVPIADVHFHYMAFMTPEDLRVRVDRHNVRWVVSAGAQDAGGPQAANDAKRVPTTSWAKLVART